MVKYNKKKQAPRKSTKGANITKKTASSVKKIVRKEIRKNVEVRKLDYQWGVQNINHNNYAAVATNKFQEKLVSFGVNTPTQGTGDNQHTGTKYKIIGQQLYLMFSVAADRLNTKFRVLILRYPSSKSISAYTDIFDSITGNIMLDPVDKDICTVLYDKITGLKNINPTNSTDNSTWYKKIWIPKQKYVVQTEDNGSSSVKFPKFTDYLMVFAFDAHGSLTTDTIGSVQVSRRLFFVDDV